MKVWKGRKMDQQQQQDRKKQKQALEQVFYVVGFLFQWGNEHPQEAQAFTNELRELVMRYLYPPNDTDSF